MSGTGGSPHTNRLHIVHQLFKLWFYTKIFNGKFFFLMILRETVYLKWKVGLLIIMKCLPLNYKWINWSVLIVKKWQCKLVNTNEKKISLVILFYVVLLGLWKLLKIKWSILAPKKIYGKWILLILRIYASFWTESV